MMSMVQILQAQLHEQSKHLMEEQTQELAKLRADQSSANSAEAAGYASSPPKALRL